MAFFLSDPWTLETGSITNLTDAASGFPLRSTTKRTDTHCLLVHLSLSWHTEIWTLPWRPIYYQETLEFMSDRMTLTQGKMI